MNINASTNLDSAAECVQRARRLAASMRYETSVRKRQNAREIAKYLLRAYRLSNSDPQFCPRTVMDTLQLPAEESSWVRDEMTQESVQAPRSDSASSHSVRHEDSGYTYASVCAFLQNRWRDLRRAVHTLNRYYISDELRWPIVVVWGVNILLLLKRLFLGKPSAYSSPRIRVTDPFVTSSGLSYTGLYAGEFMWYMPIPTVMMYLVLVCLFSGIVYGFPGAMNPDRTRRQRTG
mmetsp:Transcript_49959/g.98451  ORF Transcript_49959/g.98451 Transcript_49959/m.98451 type:complete len:234 (+) Transcript_49959:143-844(+)